MTSNKYLLAKTDYPMYRDLFLYSFNMNGQGYETNLLQQEFTKSAVYGLKENGQLMASVTAIPFQVKFFGKLFKMAGIGNVMSSPEYLPSHGIDTLMNQAFSDMHQNDVTLSYLGPFSYDYYRRFGYEQVFENKEIKLPFVKFAKRKGTMSGSLKRTDYLSAKNLIGDIFERHNHFGGVKRDEWWWETANFWSNSWQLVVSYDDAGTVDGYIIYEHNDMEFIIRDMVYETPNAFLKLTHFIGKHQSIYKTLVIDSADINLKINLFVTDPLDTVTTMVPSMMARIVDLQKFVRDYPSAVADLSEVKLQIIDRLDWNNHTWKLSVKSGQVEFAECDKETADLSMTIQTFTKPLFGYQLLNESYMVGDVTGDIKKIQELDRMFIKKSVQLKEEF